jgi:hypothetical protein
LISIEIVEKLKPQPTAITCQAYKLEAAVSNPAQQQNNSTNQIVIRSDLLGVAAF